MKTEINFVAFSGLILKKSISNEDVKVQSEIHIWRNRTDRLRGFSPITTDGMIITNHGSPMGLKSKLNGNSYTNNIKFY
jgi:hypothetical protein